MISQKLYEHTVTDYEARMKRANARAIKAITNGEYETASAAVTEAARCKAAIEELEFWMECENDD